MLTNFMYFVYTSLATLTPDAISLENSISWRFYVVGNNKPDLGLNAKCPTFLSGSVRYQISRKSVQWEASW